MYCPKCGTQNPDQVKFCGACGAVLTPAQSPRFALQSEAVGEVSPRADPPSPLVQTMPKTSGLAIAALVLGILSFFTLALTSIPAIVLGIVGLVKIKNSAGRLKGSGMAIAGIVVPAVALLPAIALLMGIFMPALARTRQLAFRMTCGTNLIGLSKAMMIYANDYDDKYPTAEKWCDLLIEKCEVTPIAFQCKGAQEGRCSYALNENVAKLGASAQQDLVLLFETHPGWNQVGGPDILTTDNHQGDGCNVAFVGGYVEFVRAVDVPNLKWKPD